MVLRMKRASVVSSLSSSRSLPIPLAPSSPTNDPDDEHDPLPPAPFEPRPPTRTLPRRRSSHLPTDDAASDAASHMATSYLVNISEHPGGDLDILPPEEDQEMRSYTSDLADFLRSTGPDEPRPTPSPLPLMAPVESRNFLKRYLRKKDSLKHPPQPQQHQLSHQPSFTGSTHSQKEATRWLTAGSVTSSGVAAINKAMHQIPPPNVETKVFANGQTIYMINTPLASSALSTTSADTNRSHSLRIPTKPVVRPGQPFVSSSAAASSPSLKSPLKQARPPIRPSTSAHPPASQQLAVPVPAKPRHASMNLSRTLSPVNSEYDYDIRFNSSSASEREAGGADLDASDIDPMLASEASTAKHRTSISSLTNRTTTTQRTSTSSGTTKRSGSVSTGTASGKEPERSCAGSIASVNSAVPVASPPTTSNTSTRQRRSGSSIAPSDASAPHSPRDRDIEWISREIRASPRMAVTPSSPLPSPISPTPGTIRDRAGSEDVPPLSPQAATIRNRSASLSIKRSSGSTGVGSNMGAPTSPPPAGPPPPPPQPIKSIKASAVSHPETSPRLSPKRVLKTRTTLIQNPSTAVPSGLRPAEEGDYVSTTTATTAGEAFYTPNTSPRVASSFSAHVSAYNQQSTPFTPSNARLFARRGSAPDAASAKPYLGGLIPPVPSVKDMMLATKAEGSPSPPIQFRGYMFPQPPDSVKGSGEDTETETEDNSVSPHALSQSPSRSSIALEKQLEDVMKMNDTYTELAVAGKHASKVMSKQQQPPVAALGSPAHVSSGSPERSIRTISASSNLSGGSSNLSNAAIGVASVVSSARGPPPRLPLPPSPMMTNISLGSPVATLVGSPATSPQAQITSLTYALHAQRSRYESLAAHVAQQQGAWDDKRTLLEARILELEAVVQQKDRAAKEAGPMAAMVDAEREQYEKRLEECEREMAEKDRRIVQLEDEKFAWERERKGLRWLVTSGTTDAGRPAASSSSSPDGRAVPMKTSDSDATVVSGDDEHLHHKGLLTVGSRFKKSVTMPSHIDVFARSPAHDKTTSSTTGTASSETSPSRRDAAYFGSAASPRGFSFPNDVQDVENDGVEAVADDLTPTPKKHTPAIVTAKQARPMSSMSSSSRTSMDDYILLHPCTASGSPKPKRHSMYESGAVSSSSAFSLPVPAAPAGTRRPLSAALDDMLLKLRNLGVEEDDSTSTAPPPSPQTVLLSSKRRPARMPVSVSLPLLSTVASDEDEVAAAGPSLAEGPVIITSDN